MDKILKPRFYQISNGMVPNNKNTKQEGPSPVCEAAWFGWGWLWLLLRGENIVKSYFVGLAQTWCCMGTKDSKKTHTGGFITTLIFPLVHI